MMTTRRMPDDCTALTCRHCEKPYEEGMTVIYVVEKGRVVPSEADCRACPRYSEGEIIPGNTSSAPERDVQGSRRVAERRKARAGVIT